ncbi:MAG: hypothetical protein V4537_14430 [Pseudomonadota bacterium]
MRRSAIGTLLIALLAFGCATASKPGGGGRLKAYQPSGRVITFDPSSQGLDAAVGDVVQFSGGTAAWVKSGPLLTDWVVFPTGGGGSVSSLAVKAASTTNLTLSGTQTIDGAAVAAGELVLATGQTAGAENGPYVVASGAWTRSTSFDAASEMIPGSLIPVYGGTLYKGSAWQFTTTGVIVVGSTSLAFTQVSPPSFGSDVSVPLVNGSSQSVTAMRLLASLTTATAGAEVGKWLVQLITAGTVSDALSIEKAQLGSPDKIFFLGEPTTFINRPSTGRFEFTGAGSLYMILNGSGLTMNSLPISPGSTSSISYNGAGSIVITPTNRHVQLGAAGAHVTTDVGGYVTIAGTPGTPTGVPGNLASGHVPMAIDTTNGKPCWFYGAAWHCTVAALTP